MSKLDDEPIEITIPFQEAKHLQDLLFVADNCLMCQSMTNHIQQGIKEAAKKVFYGSKRIEMKKIKYT